MAFRMELLDIVLLAVFGGAVVLGGITIAYETVKSETTFAIEAWAKEKGHRVIYIKQDSILSHLMQSVTYEVAYETESGERGEIVAAYSRAFSGLAKSLVVEPKTFNYNKY